MKDGVSYLVPFILITSCFALWGFANDITNPMVKAFSKIFRMSSTDGALVQVAFYGGYFAMAFPAAIFIRRFFWVAHGEGKFSLPYPEDHYNVVLKYSYDEYPGNPNGSDYSVAGIASQDGRHLAMMPHLERACFPWENAYYPLDRKEEDQITPWMEAFVNARKWVEANRKK